MSRSLYGEVAVGQRVTVGVGVIGVAVGQRVRVGVMGVVVAFGFFVMVKVGVMVGFTVPGPGVGVRVMVGQGVRDGVRVGVRDGVTVIVVVGVGVTVGVGVGVGVEVGGFPITLKNPTCLQSYPKKIWTWYSPGSHSSDFGDQSEYPMPPVPPAQACVSKLTSSPFRYQMAVH
jgi:hypothetical protein